MKVCCKFFILLFSFVLQLKCDAEALVTTVTSDYFTVDTRREYFVRFNANEDEDYPVTGIMENQHFYFNEEKALTSNAYKRVGFDFGGWVVHPIHVAKNYADGEVVYETSAEGTTDIVPTAPHSIAADGQGDGLFDG